ncbi:unnamed protein product [Sphagnum jensenii]|uniref:Kinesin motor domain-containing protein n=1 Tax=Sphagnum jensenii TaxID=128206 RepID=A0ABP0WBY9_9BRYO
MVRHSPKKVATQEDMISGHFPNGDELTISSSLSRKPLSSISEGSRNSLSEKTSDENNCPDMPLMSKGKMTSDHLASKGKRKNSPMTSPAAPPRHSESNQESCANATPRTHRKLIMNESGEPGAAVAAASSTTFPAATPCKSATRSLRFGTSANGGVLAATGTSSFFSTHRPGLPPVVSSGGQALQQHASVETHFELEEDPTFWEDHNVQVLIRTRPISSSEMAVQGFSRCLKQENAHTISWIGQPESRFTFDHVADEAVTQEKLFKVAGLPMVENCMAGYNSCMFAYGQTGSGKTHTMLGDIENLENKPSDNRGMTPRVFEYLFARIRREEEEREMENLKFLTKCSFLEIYNEQITDLLEPSSTNLQMREDARKGVYVENLSEVEVHNVQDVIQLLIQGAANRKVAATNMNRESSRSHSVFTCIIESKWECDSMTNIRFGRLNLVDLAGSERQKSSGAEGERLKEAANINKSLSTLGLVIMILVDVANGKPRHVPYRDSKLTFLLQDSLGGNSKTTMIATVSPSSCNALETLSTLKFAQRAKLIHNTAVVNEDASGDVKALRAQIQQMKDELDRLRRQSISRIPLTQENFESIHHSFDSSVDMIISKLSSGRETEMEQTPEKEEEMSAVYAYGSSSLRGGEDGHPERLLRAQKVEMRHAEEIMQLQLELDSMEAVLGEERAHRKEVEEKLANLQVARLQLSSPDQKWVHLSSQLEQEKVLVEALESQQLFAIKELEDLQAEHETVLGKLKRTEDREKILRNKIHELMKEQELHDADCAACVEVLEEMTGGAMDDSQRLALEEKLAAATQEVENARGLNVKLQKMEQEKNLTQSQAETETALAITSIQSELLNVTDEAELLNKDLRDAREQIESLRSMLQDAQEQLLHLGVKYDDMLKAKNAEIQVLQAEQQSVTAGLIDYLAGRDQALNEASLEVEQMFDEYLPQMDNFTDEPEHMRRMCDESERLGHVSSMHAIGFSEIDSLEMHLDDLSLDTITEEVDLFIAHCLNQMGTLGLEMKSLRTDISGSFFQIPHAGLQQDVEKIFQAHRDEISVLIIKIAGLEELLEERSGKVSILQELLDAAQERLQSFTSAQEKSELELHSSEASLEAAKAELEMSEAAVRELLDAARETDAVILDLKTNLQQRIENETKVEAEVKVCQQQAQDVQLEMDELHATVGLLQQELATKEEFIKELENSIQLLEKTVSSETEQKEEAIIQLQGELNSRNNEVCMLLDQQCKLEGDITKKIQELGLIKEELDTMNDRVVQAVEERDGLCKQVQNMQFEMDQLKTTVKSLQREIATKEEFITGLEKTGNSKTQQVHLLNARLAESESMTHDVVRDLLGVKLEVSDYVDRFHEQEIKKLRQQLNEFIEERERWLEEINKGQAEIVAARVSAEKFRQRDQVLTTENEKIKAENFAHQTRIGDLEQEVRKLSGQQNLQQRIHHHAKIKDENNALRLQVEDLSGRLRSMEIMFARVKDELARYRTAAGRTPFPNLDEEQRLKSKLQEAANNQIEMAQNFISLCTRIMQAAGISNSGHVDQSIALEALQRIENRLQTNELELSELRLQTRIAGEKRRLSDMKIVDSPMKSINIPSAGYSKFVLPEKR